VGGKNCITRSFIILLFTKYYYGDLLKEVETDGKLEEKISPETEA
jgi:hypothetical protein